MISELAVDRAESVVQAGIVAEKIRTVVSELYSLIIQRDGKTEKAITGVWGATERPKQLGLCHWKSVRD